MLLVTTFWEIRGNKVSVNKKSQHSGMSLLIVQPTSDETTPTPARQNTATVASKTVICGTE